MIREPMTFDRAIDFIREKQLAPARFSTEGWNEFAPDVRAKSFFSASVESSRFLERAKRLIRAFIERETEVVGVRDGQEIRALKVTGRSDFVVQMRRFMVAEGMASKEDFVGNNTDLQDIRSADRLSLIFETNVRQAFGFGQWRQSTLPEVIEAFPAARLIRERPVDEPRERHETNLGQVRLKTDPWWANWINGEDIGGFGVPWGPYGFNSGCNQISVTAAEWETYKSQNPPAVDDGPEPALAIVFPPPTSPAETEAGTKTLSPEIKDKLRAHLKTRMDDARRQREQAQSRYRERIAAGLPRDVPSNVVEFDSRITLR